MAELIIVTYNEYNEIKTSKTINMTNPTQPRTLDVIAREIARDPAYSSSRWCAEPYRSSMASLNSLSDSYGADSARSIVLYFLSNTAQWRGETARRIKAELRAMLKESK